MALALEQSPPVVSKASNKCRTGAGSCRKCTSRVYPPTLKRLKKKHLPGVEVLESCQSVKAGSYFFVSSVCDVVSCESSLIGVKGIAVTLSK